MKEFFGKFLIAIDLFSYNEFIFFDNKNKLKTSLGGFISYIFIIISFALLTSSIFEVLEKDSKIINKYNMLLPEKNNLSNFNINFTLYNSNDSYINPNNIEYSMDYIYTDIRKAKDSITKNLKFNFSSDEQSTSINLNKWNLEKTPISTSYLRLNISKNDNNFYIKFIFQNIYKLNEKFTDYNDMEFYMSSKFPVSDFIFKTVYYQNKNSLSKTKFFDLKKHSQEDIYFDDSYILIYFKLSDFITVIKVDKTNYFSLFIEKFIILQMLFYFFKFVIKIYTENYFIIKYLSKFNIENVKGEKKINHDSFIKPVWKIKKEELKPSLNMGLKESLDDNSKIHLKEKNDFNTQNKENYNNTIIRISKFGQFKDNKKFQSKNNQQLDVKIIPEISPINILYKTDLKKTKDLNNLLGHLKTKQKLKNVNIFKACFQNSNYTKLNKNLNLKMLNIEEINKKIIQLSNKISKIHENSILESSPLSSSNYIKEGNQSFVNQSQNNSLINK